jgi:hypothetical protein
MNDQIRSALETIASRGSDPGATEVWQQAFRAAPKRRRRRRARAALAATTALLVIAGVVVALHAGRSPSRQVVVAPPTTAKSSLGTPEQPVTVFDRIVESDSSAQQVAPDADGGAWFAFNGALKHLDATGSVTVVRLAKQWTFMPDNDPNPIIAVDPDGTVWALGQTNFAKPKLGATLAEVTPGAGAAKLIPLGQLPDAGRGPNGFGAAPTPYALASDGAGHVALALLDTSVVRVYDSRHGTFTDVRLPTSTEALSLRYFGDGKLAIGLAGYVGRATTAIIASTDGSRSQPIEVGESTVAKPYSDTAVLFGEEHPTILYSDGTTHPVTLAAGVLPYPNVGAVQVGRNGTLVVATPTGVTFVDGTSGARAAATYAYPIGDLPCGPDTGTGSFGTTGPYARLPTTGCLVPPRVAVAPNGAVWVFNLVETRRGNHFLVQRIDRY